jgi:hypothetical protein
MQPIKPADARQMRLAVLNGMGSALGFLLLYMAMEHIHPGIAKKLKGE